jgi:hypothetical protein
MRVTALLAVSLVFLYAADAPLPVPSNLKPNGVPQIPHALSRV